MTEILKFDRRAFLRLTGLTGAGLILGVGFGGCKDGQSGPDPAETFTPNAFVTLDVSGAITVVVARSEMGQGVRTALPMILAEELDADFAQVTAVGALADESLYGDMSTGGSTSVREMWQPLREAGAAARVMLVRAAAARWKVGEAECRTEASAVVHDASGRSLTYAELVPGAAAQPVPSDATLKNPADYRLLGTSPLRLDGPAKVDGSATYALDVRLPGMRFASVQRCPVLGGQHSGCDTAAALSVPGVEQVVPIDSGMAVVADSTWAALKGREALVSTWDEGANADLDSAGLWALLGAAAQEPCLEAKRVGDPEGALAGAATSLQAEYRVPFWAHAPMEPMVCVADVRADGCEVWAPTQNATSAQERVATLLGLGKSQVSLHTTLLGGGFGSRHGHGFVLEAVQVSQAIGAPVQVLWTRTDDLRHGHFRPASLHLLEGGLDAGGELSALSHVVAAPSISAFLNGSAPGLDMGAVQGVHDHPYTVPNFLAGYAPAQTPVPIMWWRSVYLSQNPFAHESFIDELAHAAGRDPVDFRLGLLTGLVGVAPRMKAVLELAADRAGWGDTLPATHGQGVACVSAYGSCIAMVAEASWAPGSEVRVHRIVAALDCGQVIHPDLITAQVEGAVAFTLSAALKDEITFAQGGVVQSNFGDYPILALDEMPEVEVYLVQSSAGPGGIGELAVGPTAPAVANALFAATGQRLRSLPLRPA